VGAVIVDPAGISSGVSESRHPSAVRSADPSAREMGPSFRWGHGQLERRADRGV